MQTTKKINARRVTTAARHTVTVPLKLEDEQGNVEQVEARVVYRGLSLRSVADLDDRLKDEDGRNNLIKGLSEIVIALPDFGDDDGNEITPDAEFFDTLDTKVLRAINRAIRRDNNPED
jgi:hypothetical protein